MYVVQAGDTLLDIALRFGVDLGALQAANPGVDARALQVGQTLVIPGGNLALPTAVPVVFAIAPPTCYDTVSGTLCLGLIGNLTIHTLQNLRVQVQLINPNGVVEDTQTSVPDQRILPSGESAPYRVQFAHPWLPGTQVTASLVSATALPDGDNTFLRLTMDNEQGTTTDGGYAITASLLNSTPDTAVSIRVVATLVDSVGRVIGYRVIALPDTLPADARLPVRIVVTPQSGTVPAIHHLYAEALRSK